MLFSYRSIPYRAKAFAKTPLLNDSVQARRRTKPSNRKKGSLIRPAVESRAIIRERFQCYFEAARAATWMPLRKAHLSELKEAVWYLLCFMEYKPRRMSSYQFGIRPTRLLAGNSVKVVEVWQAFGKYDQNKFGNFLQVRQMLTHGNKVCSNFYGKHFQNLRNFGVCSSAEMRTSCRSQKMLQNDYVLCT